MKLYMLQRQQSVDAPLEEVFAFFGRPENLALLTPPDLGFRMVTPAPVEMKEGARIDYTIRLLGRRVGWTTFISEFRPPYRFVDRQLRGPYAWWDHTHAFTAAKNATLMTDEVRYALPFGILGRAVHALFVRRRLEKIFNYRRDAIAARFSRIASAQERLPLVEERHR